MAEALALDPEAPLAEALGDQSCRRAVAGPTGPAVGLILGDVGRELGGLAAVEEHVGGQALR